MGGPCRVHLLFPKMKNLTFFTCRVQMLGIVMALIWINGLSTLTILCQTSPKTLPVPLQMASNPILTLDTELSSKENSEILSMQSEMMLLPFIFMVDSVMNLMSRFTINIRGGNTYHFLCSGST